MSFIIRQATVKDLSQMYHISTLAHQANYADLIPPERRDDFNRRYTITPENEQKYIHTLQSHLNDPSWYVWVAVEGETVLGYTLAQKVNEHRLLKKGLFMHPDYQGQGVGSALFKDSLEPIKTGEIFLSVIANNERAKHIYEKAGFVIIEPDEKKFFGAEQVVMKLTKH